MNGQQRVIIENVKPQINCGYFPARRVANDSVKIEADIFSDSHDVLSAEVLYRYEKGKTWMSTPMDHDMNDRWFGYFTVSKLGIYVFTIRSWVDKFKTWHRDILKKIEAESDFGVDLLIGASLINDALIAYPKISKKDSDFLIGAMTELKAKNRKAKYRADVILDQKLYKTMLTYPVKDFVSRYHKELKITVDREKANFSSWYEVFPRSLGAKTGQHGTFKDCIRFLPYVAEMGFDVLYLPPIHPIGEKNRKGKNNNVKVKPGEPGSPWAIGNKIGGHKAIHPQLGNLSEFKLLVKKASGYGIEIALDIAFQCSPDHPYVKDHPDWFKKRPDGTLQYAENPPKKYEDIYPLNFETEDWRNLWEELKSIFLYWINNGVKIFRVDNPHTKSLKFWEWVMKEVRKAYPETIFLAEAFTRPKIMNQLAKLGFNQSYTYFTWRNTKYELISYCEELVKSEAIEYFRPNFWPNTPDILPYHLQGAGRPAFVQRLILAATLSSNYGIYGPAFELMENIPTEPGKEEYLNSEKYELKNWDIGHGKSLVKVIARLNTIRKANKALQHMRSLKFHTIDNDALICYSKISEEKDNFVLMIVNLDTNQTQSGMVRVPLNDFNLDPDTPFEVYDMLSGSYYQWKGEYNFVALNPGIMPAHIFKVNK
jgi:starch synthase (maltosyl-transferring)